MKIIIRDSFKTDSVNVVKNRPFVAKKVETQKKAQYIRTWLSHIKKPWKLSLGTTRLKTFICHTGLPQTPEKLDDLEKYWASNTSNL